MVWLPLRCRPDRVRLSLLEDTPPRLVCLAARKLIKSTLFGCPCLASGLDQGVARHVSTPARLTHKGAAMRTMERTSQWRQRAGLAVGATALCATYACGSGPGVAGVSAQPAAASQSGAPIVVGCEPHQRTLVRQTMINGAAVSQVECVSAVQPAGAPMEPAPVAYAQPASAYALAPGAHTPAPAVYAPPVTYTPQPATRPVARAGNDDLHDAQVVRTTSGRAGPVRTRQVIYDDRPARPTRSAAKSAVIIGSSAGAGAGVGAAVGGKKGALIGAAIGGGGAAVWDQVTRRK